jgi:soluble cytochrome b562
MASYNRAASGMGYTGYPARIFFEMTNYGKGTQTYEEKRLILHKWYSHLTAYLQEQLKTNDQIDDYNNNIAPLLEDVAEHIRLARKLYKPTFESVMTCDPDEKDFQEVMDGIVERLDVITAKSKVIDKVKPDSEDVTF